MGWRHPPPAVACIGVPRPREKLTGKLLPAPDGFSWLLGRLGYARPRQGVTRRWSKAPPPFPSAPCLVFPVTRILPIGIKSRWRTGRLLLFTLEHDQVVFVVGLGRELRRPIPFAVFYAAERQVVAVQLVNGLDRLSVFPL